MIISTESLIIATLIVLFFIVAPMVIMWRYVQRDNRRRLDEPLAKEVQKIDAWLINKGYKNDYSD